MYLGFSVAALVTAMALAFHVNAQTVDPFGALYAPPPGTAAPSTRTGSTGVNTATGGSYAAAQNTGFASLAHMAILPKVVAPLPIRTKEHGGKYLNRTKRVAVPTYALTLVRAGKVSAWGGGWGSESVGRKTSITTVLVGVSDELAAQLADEAYKDLSKRLADAGFEVIPVEQVLADPDIARIKTYGTKTGEEALTTYSPSYAPLRAWAPFMPPMAGAGASMAYGKATKTLDAIIISPGMSIDYQQLESSGNRTYAGNAFADAKVHFGIGQGSGANLIVWPAPPYKGGWPSSILMDKPSGSDEPFGIMYETDDKSDSVALQRAFASLGSNMYRQSKYYAVEVEPNRYAALVRAAFQGLNASIVAELKKKNGA